VLYDVHPTSDHQGDAQHDSHAAEKAQHHEPWLGVWDANSKRPAEKGSRKSRFFTDVPVVVGPKTEGSLDTKIKIK
jgi:hypothetical protein